MTIGIIGSGAIGPAYVTGSGGETSTRLYDVDGDNKLDVILGTSSGELYAVHANGTPVASFNHGQPVQTEVSALAQHHPIPASLPPPRGTGARAPPRR